MFVPDQKLALAVIDSLATQAQTNLSSVGDFMQAHESVLFIAGWSSFVGVVTYVALSWVDRRRSKKPTGDVEEMRKRAILDQKYADRFGDALFDMLMNDEIDRHEYKRACRRFGIAYRLRDLLVRKNDKRGRKYRIINNCTEMQRTPSATRKGERKELGPKPGHDVPVLVAVPKRVRKVWVATGKAMLRRKSA